VTRRYHWKTKRSDWEPLCGVDLKFDGIAYTHAGVTCETCRSLSPRSRRSTSLAPSFKLSFSKGGVP
jgi:hypothetical protein